MAVGYRQPETIEDALDDLDHDGAVAIAGGISVSLEMYRGGLRPSRLVSLARLPGLRGVRSEPGELVVGALSTHGSLLRSELLARIHPELITVFADVGNVRVRAIGTIGGNLAYADPSQDPVVLLSALGATVSVAGRDGVRMIAVEDLPDGPFATTLAPGEIITELRIPDPAPDSRTAWVKLQSSSLDDYATVNAGVHLRLSEDGRPSAIRLFVGAAASRPRRIDGAAVLLDRELHEGELFEAVADSVRATVDPSANHRGSVAYKKDLAAVAAVRALRRCAGPESDDGRQAGQ